MGKDCTEDASSIPSSAIKVPLFRLYMACAVKWSNFQFIIWTLTAYRLSTGRHLFCLRVMAKKKCQEKFSINFLHRRIYVRRQESEPQKGRVSILPRSGIDLKGFTVSTFINILSSIFISLLSWFIGLYFRHSDIALPFPSSLTYLRSDVLSASV